MKITAQIICDIIKKGLSLTDNQIWIYNQRRSIPEEKGLFVVVGMMAMKPYGNNNRNTANANGQYDNLTQYMQETITIDVMSYTTEAVERYAEVMGALTSTYSQQIQESLGLKIASIPSTMNDVSQVEGASLIYRIAITLQVLRKYEKIIGATYYDNFDEVDTSKHQV
jgi:hypothetical protein